VKPPPPPKPARVSFIAYPGGRITVAGKPIGHDATGNVVLPPGVYEIVVENQFLGTRTSTVELTAGQTGVITIKW
jgi:hypothetical protein